MTPRQLMQMVADYHDITVGDLTGPSQKRAIAWPRQEAMFVVRQALGYSFPRIGWLFSRDHTTVMHGVEATKDRMRRDPEIVGRVSGFIVKAKEAAL